MDQDEDFKKKRQEFSINIRKNNREQIIMKRRNLDSSENTMNEKKEFIIVDENLRTALEKYLLFHIDYLMNNLIKINWIS